MFKVTDYAALILAVFSLIELMHYVTVVSARKLCHQYHIWASAQENLSSWVCQQQRRRPSCGSAQTDQRLCYSPIGKNHILTCYEQNFNVLASLCSWGDWLESPFHGKPKTGVVAVRPTYAK